MAMKECFKFPKAPGLEPNDEMFECHIQGISWCGRGLTPCEDAVGVLYTPSQLRWMKHEAEHKIKRKTLKDQLINIKDQNYKTK